MANNKEFCDRFGASVKMLRMKQDVTQKQLAEAVGISPASIISYEKGTLCPPLDVAVKIAAFFKAPLEGFYSDEVLQPRTNADIMKMLVAIGESADIFFGKILYPDHLWYGEDYVPEADGEPPEVTGIFFCHHRLRGFVERWEQMRTLMNAGGPVDKDVFALWLQKELNKGEEDRLVQ